MRQTIWAAAFLFLLIVGGCHLLHRSKRVDAKSPVQKMKSDFTGALMKRSMEVKFNEFGSDLSNRLRNNAAGEKCRLLWLEQLLGDPLSAVARSEQFTRELYDAANTGTLPRLIDQIAGKLDALEARQDHKAAPPLQFADPLQAVISVIHATREGLNVAFRPLSESERSELRDRLYTQTTAEATLGYRFGGDDAGWRIVDLLQRIDRKQLLRAARELSTLSDPKLLDTLAKLRRTTASHEPGVDGEIFQRIDTPDGTIIVGGPGRNSYHLDQLPHVCAIIDVGGNDTYLEGATAVERPVLIILDLSGDDVYRGKTPGIQGGSIMGASLVIDRSGDDIYTAGDVAQGSALAGIGILIDNSGNDSYRGDRRVQGQAIAGIGLLIDRSGDDDYRAALLAQGVGGPLGFGLLADIEGNDHYFAGGKYLDSYEDTPGFGGWSQGVGVGARDVADGGIGVLLDGAGDDIYEADYFSHGGGYWFGAGMARDFGGDDQRLGATRLNFDGSARSEPRYLRWGIAFGCHYGAGFLFDDVGDDIYEGNWASIAYAWDFSLAVLCDFDGDDRYISEGSGVAEAHNVGLAILYDRSGDDYYSGEGLGKAEAQSKSHPDTIPYGSFALLLDGGGHDRFSQPFANHTNIQRGWPGGFLIDR